MKRSHRINSRRETKFMPLEMDTVRLDGRFSGYASIFGEIDEGRDVVAQGAFSSSLNAKPASAIRMLFQHNPDEPIGVWTTIKEDRKGLYVEGKVTRGVTRCEEILELMRAGAIDGLSIGFKTKRAKNDASTRTRRILEADLWEISVVTFPLLENARISSIKSAQAASEGLPTLREFERWLTRDAGLSRRDARTVLSDGYHQLACKQDAARFEPLQATIRRATQTLMTRN